MKKQALEWAKNQEWATPFTGLGTIIDAFAAHKRIIAKIEARKGVRK